MYRDKKLYVGRVCVVREETETNTWSYYLGLFFSKGQTFSTTRAVSVSSGKDNSNAAAAA